MSLLKIKKGTFLLNWNDNLKMNLDYYSRLFGLLLIFAIPFLINAFLIYPGELSLWKGVVGYSTFIGLFYVMVRQRHRCTHISSYQNPFYLGLVLNLFVDNYLTYYGVLNDSMLNLFLLYTFLNRQFFILKIVHLICSKV